MRVTFGVGAMLLFTAACATFHLVPTLRVSAMEASLPRFTNTLLRQYFPEPFQARDRVIRKTLDQHRSDDPVPAYVELPAEAMRSMDIPLTEENQSVVRRVLHDLDLRMSLTQENLRLLAAPGTDVRSLYWADRDEFPLKHIERNPKTPEQSIEQQKQLLVELFELYDRLFDALDSTGIYDLPRKSSLEILASLKQS